MFYETNSEEMTTDHYPLVNPVQYFPALPLHSVEISSIGGIIYSAVKVYFCYKIMLKEHSSGIPWEGFLELLK